MKRHLPILLVFFFILPMKSIFAEIIESPKPYDYRYGLLDDKYIISSNGFAGVYYDNSLNNHYVSSSNGGRLVKFREPVDIKGMYIKIMNYTSNIKINFVGAGNNSYGFPHNVTRDMYVNLDYKGVTEINIDPSNNSFAYIYEIDFFGSYEKNSVANVTGLQAVTKFNSATLSWVNPVNAEFVGVRILRDKVKIADVAKSANSFAINGLNPNSQYKYEIEAVYADGSISEPHAIEFSTEKIPVVTELKASPEYNRSRLNWTNPPSTADFMGVTIKRDGTKIIDLAKPANSYMIANLQAETAYTYEVVVRYAGGFESAATSVNFTTLIAPEDAGNVSDLTAKASHNRVDLSWILPDSDNFKHVKIYRETLQRSFLDKLLGVTTVMAATPIFETNGTYFNDLTVAPETKYEYTLTTLSTESVESDGVSITVTTLADPTPIIDGGGYDKDPETGDFTYYWSEPTTGTVKIMVGGKLYATVQAADGEIVIPGTDMKYTIFGNPDVQLIPVDEDGNEGKPVKPPVGGGDGGDGGGSDGGNGSGSGAAELPFGASDLIKATFSFIRILGPFLLVWLSIYLTPRLIAIIKKSMKNKGVERSAG